MQLSFFPPFIPVLLCKVASPFFQMPLQILHILAIVRHFSPVWRLGWLLNNPGLWLLVKVNLASVHTLYISQYFCTLATAYLFKFIFKPF